MHFARAQYPIYNLSTNQVQRPGAGSAEGDTEASVLSNQLRPMHNEKDTYQQARAVGDATSPVPDASELADISSVNRGSPCLVLLRRNKTLDAAQTPLVIAHSLFGDTAHPGDPLL